MKARPTPYCLYSIVTAPSDCDTGIGNSPPARKLAVSPESAVRFGSARIVARPSVCGEIERPSRSRPNSLPAAPSVVPTEAMLKPFGIAAVLPLARRTERARVALADAELEPAGRIAAKKVDADLLQHVAAHLGDLHLQRDLQRSRDLEAADRHDVKRGVGLGHVDAWVERRPDQHLGLGRIFGRSDGAVDHCDLADRLHADIRVRHRLRARCR